MLRHGTLFILVVEKSAKWKGIWCHRKGKKKKNHKFVFIKELLFYATILGHSWSRGQKNRNEADTVACVYTMLG